MRPSPSALRHACTLLSTVLLAALLVTVSGAPAARDIEATSGSTYLCSGYAGCRAEGFSDGGYGAVNDRMYWNMYPGHNCTNYVAYRMIRAGMSPKRPFGYPGNATNWGEHLSDRVNDTPRVGAVAWWRKYDNGSGSAGHVAYVERVTSKHIVISEDSWGGTFHWRRIDRGSWRWPTGFIHLVDRAIENTVRPRVIGTAKLGERLRTTTGRWNVPDPQLTYRWLVGNEVVDWARGRYFKVRPAHIGKRIRSKVIARKPGWEKGRKHSAKTAPAQPGDFTVVERPVVSGVPIRGEELTVDVGSFTPEPSSISVRWFADGTRIDGASQRTLKLDDSMVGSRVTARVTARRDHYANRRVRSAPTEEVSVGAVTVTEEPSLPRRARIGKVLTVDPGTVTPAKGTVPSYQWVRNGVPIGGATGESYRTAPADFDSTLGVRVTYEHPTHHAAEAETTLRYPIRARTRMEVETRIRGRLGHQVVFIVDVEPQQVPATFSGDVTVRFDGRERRITTDDGRARVHFRRVPHGTHPAVVIQHPNSRFAWSRDRFRVEVARP